MQKMRLVHPDRLVASTSTSTPAKEKEELKMLGKKNVSDDVQLAEFQDAFIRKQDKKKNLEEKNMSDFAKKIKPLLAGNITNMEEVLKAFTGDEQIVAQNILNILARIPRVSFNNNKLLIDGEAVKDDLVQIIKEMMQNDVNGAESVIQILRGKLSGNSGRRRGTNDDSDMPFARSFDETLVPYLASGGFSNEAGASGFSLPVHQSTPMPSGKKSKKSPPYKLRATSLLRKDAVEELKQNVNPIKPKPSKARRKLNKSQGASPSPRKALQKVLAQEAKKNGGNKPRDWLGY